MYEGVSKPVYTSIEAKNRSAAACRMTCDCPLSRFDF